MRLFCHLALDRFGAECLGRLDQYLADVGDPARERHRFIWAGAGEPPTRASYWVKDVPEWDHLAPLPWPADAGNPTTDLECDRQTIVDLLRDAFAAEQKLGSFIRDLATQESVRVFGPHVACTSTWTLSGSLCDPTGSAILLGLWRGLALLRQSGFQIPGTYVFVSTGHESGRQGASQRQELVQALAARGLLDIQDNLRKQTDVLDWAMPVYVVGGDVIHEQICPDRRTLQSLLALSIVACTRALVEAGAGNPTQGPFSFRILGDARAMWDAVPYSADATFLAVGAYAVRSPRESLVRLMAARYCGDFLDVLSRQKSFGSLNDWALVRPPGELESMLAVIESRAVGYAWRRADEDGRAAWNEDEIERGRWFQPTCVRRLLRPVFENSTWRRLFDVYGPSRMRAIDLDDWNAALDELSMLIEEGYVKSRDTEIATAIRRILLRLHAGLQHGLDEVFERTFQEPIGAEPHRTAQVFLGRVLNGIRRDRDMLEKAQAFIPRRAAGDLNGLRQQLARSRDQLTRMLSDAPSPTAVILRLLPVCGASAGLAFALPDAWVPGAAPWRLAVAGLLSLVSGAIVWERMVLSVRRRLNKQYEHWLARYRLVLEADDRERERKALELAYGRMEGFLRWFAESDEVDPPLPPPHGLVSESAHDERFVAADSAEILRSQSVVCRFREHLSAARDRMRSAETHLREQYQTSLVDTNLPEIVVGDDHVVAVEYAKLLNVPGPGRAAAGPTAADPQVIGTFARNCLEWMGRQVAVGMESDRRIPYTPPGAAGEAPRHQCWQRTFLIADGGELRSPEVRNANSGFQFFDTVCRYIEQSGLCTAGLMARLDGYVRDQGAASLQETRLFERATQWCTPSVRVASGRSQAVFIGCADADYFAPRGCPRNAWGRGSFSATVLVSGPLSAELVIYYPNQDAPVNSLGKAWNSVKAAAGNLLALKPVEWRK